MAMALELLNRLQGLSLSPIRCTLSGGSPWLPTSPTTRIAFATLGICRIVRVSGYGWAVVERTCWYI